MSVQQVDGGAVVEGLGGAVVDLVELHAGLLGVVWPHIIPDTLAAPGDLALPREHQMKWSVEHQRKWPKEQQGKWSVE